MREEQLEFIEKEMIKLETKEEELLLGIQRSLFLIENQTKETNTTLKWILFLLIAIAISSLKSFLG